MGTLLNGRNPFKWNLKPGVSWQFKFDPYPCGECLAWRMFPICLLPQGKEEFKALSMVANLTTQSSDSYEAICDIVMIFLRHQTPSARFQAKIALTKRVFLGKGLPKEASKLDPFSLRAKWGSILSFRGYVVICHWRNRAITLSHENTTWGAGV